MRHQAIKENRDYSLTFDSLHTPLRILPHAVDDRQDFHGLHFFMASGVAALCRDKVRGGPFDRLRAGKRESLHLPCVASLCRGKPAPAIAPNPPCARSPACGRGPGGLDPATACSDQQARAAHRQHRPVECSGNDRTAGASNPFNVPETSVPMNDPDVVYSVIVWLPPFVTKISEPDIAMPCGPSNPFAVPEISVPVPTGTPAVAAPIALGAIARKYPSRDCDAPRLQACN